MEYPAASLMPCEIAYRTNPSIHTSSGRTTTVKFWLFASVADAVCYTDFKDIVPEVAKVLWHEVREKFPDEWVVCEAMRLRSEEGYCYVDEVAVIDRYDDSTEAMKRYYELHRKEPNREYGFYHTSREILKLREKWAGVRGPR